MSFINVWAFTFYNLEEWLLYVENFAHILQTTNVKNITIIIISISMIIIIISSSSQFKTWWYTSVTKALLCAHSWTANANHICQILFSSAFDVWLLHNCHQFGYLYIPNCYLKNYRNVRMRVVCMEQYSVKVPG
jgi:hypothetical protein